MNTRPIAAEPGAVDWRASTGGLPWWCLGAALLGALLMLVQGRYENAMNQQRSAQLRAAIDALPQRAAAARGSAERDAARAWALVVKEKSPGPELAIAALNLLSQHTPPGVLIERVSWNGERLQIQGLASDSVSVARLAVRWDTAHRLDAARRSCQPRVLSNEPVAASGAAEPRRRFTIGFRCANPVKAAATPERAVADDSPAASGMTLGAWLDVLHAPLLLLLLAVLALLALWRAVAGVGRPWPAIGWHGALARCQAQPGGPWPRPLRGLALMLALGLGGVAGAQLERAWLADADDEAALRQRLVALLSEANRPADAEAAVSTRALMAAERGDALPGLQRQLAAALAAGTLAAAEVTAGDEAVKDFYAQRTLVLTLRSGFDAGSRWLAQTLADPLRRLTVTNFDLQGGPAGELAWRLELAAVRPVSADEAAARRRDAARGKTP